MFRIGLVADKLNRTISRLSFTISGGRLVAATIELTASFLRVYKYRQCDCRAYCLKRGN